MKNIQPKKSSRLFILLGVVLTVLSMIGVYAISGSGSSKPSSVGTVPVVVASQLIPSRTVFGSVTDAASWMKVENVPKNILPPQYFASVQAFAAQELKSGKVFNGQTLLPNEEVVSAQFTRLGSRPNYTGALELPKDDVAVSLEASLVNEAGGAITPGDYVDLVASYLPSGGGSGGGNDTFKGASSVPTQTQMVLQNLKVIAVGPFVPGSTETSVAASGSTMLTFQADRQTALLIQHLKDFAGSWNLSIFLRSAYSTKIYSESPVTGNYLFSHLRDNFEKK